MKTQSAVLLIAATLLGGGAALAQDAAGSQKPETSVGQKIDDTALLAKIKADLLATRSVDGLDINVDVKEGRVTLSGTAKTEAERTKAESIARDTKGVMSVENRIVLKNR